MERAIELWTIAGLRERYFRIEFPEYQREPSIWSKKAKQRLVDSILRQFDVASLYLSPNGDGSYDCIDGRQRINAIMAFLGLADDDPDKGFAFEVLNEIYDDVSHPFQAISGMNCQRMHEEAATNEVARKALEQLLAYQLTVVLLSDAQQGEDFNLQFTRLNLGTIINAGEKLHAMVGEMRDLCFSKESKVGGHEFLGMVGVPGRRFAREQLGATILAQMFAFNKEGHLTRTRHFDLQRFLKDYSVIGSTERRWIEEAVETMAWLVGAVPRAGGLLRNRAMVVSVVLLAWRLGLREGKKGHGLEGFLDEFLCRLTWQVRKGLSANPDYHYLIDFQKHVTQASVERPAVEARHQTLAEEFARWRESHELKGDSTYRASGNDPTADCRSTQ